MAERLVRSFDVDDTLVDRGRLVRAFGLAVEKARGGTHKTVDLSSVPQNDHSPQNTRITSILEKLSLTAHSRRNLIAGVGTALAQTREGENPSNNVVNTGRSNKLEWTQMTIGQLTRLGIDPYVQRYTFKPSGMSSTESKLDVIRGFLEDGNDVEHFEDDPRTALVIAATFPDVTVHLVNHTITGMMIPRTQLAGHSNIHIVSHIGEGI